MRYLLPLCLFMAACGHDTASSVSGGPSSVAPSLIAPEASCAPPSLSVDARDMTAWFTVSASAYEVEVQVLDGSGWRDVGRTTGSSWTPPPPLGFGDYRARVRTCGAFGEWVEFKFGGSGFVPEVPPVPPQPPVPPFSASVCFSDVFGKGVVRRKALAVPAGAYRVEVTTSDPKHRAGYQPEQTQEVVTVRGIGTTEDIPEAATSHVTVFSVTLPALAEVVIEGGKHSVHGVCVTFTEVR